jgi:hypothetical protein
LRAALRSYLSPMISICSNHWGSPRSRFYGVGQLPPRVCAHGRLPESPGTLRHCRRDQSCAPRIWARRIGPRKLGSHRTHRWRGESGANSSLKAVHRRSDEFLESIKKGSKRRRKNSSRLGISRNQRCPATYLSTSTQPATTEPDAALIITPSWSDGSPFTGTLSFAPPHSNDQATFP